MIYIKKFYLINIHKISNIIRLKLVKQIISFL